MFDILDKPYDWELNTFGKNWCGPTKYTNWKRELVAKFPKSPSDGDGQSVEVYCTPAPARFYELVALPEPNSVGDPQEGFVVSFGSGQWELAKQVAVAISEGMIGFAPANKVLQSDSGDSPAKSEDASE